jgi:hypothetical protein
MPRFICTKELMENYMSAYNIVLIIVAMALAALSNIRICFFLVDKKWGHDDGNGVFILIASTVATLVIFGYLGYDAIMVGGNFYGLGLVAASIPLTGAIWAYVVGINKVIQRTLLGLCKKLA